MDTVYNDLTRPPKELIDGFRAVLREYSPSCLVTDARRRVGAIGGLLPVRPEHRVAGPALTVNLSIDDLLAGTRVQNGKERTIRDKIGSGATVTELLAEFGHL